MGMDVVAANIRLEGLSDKNSSNMGRLTVKLGNIRVERQLSVKWFVVQRPFGQGVWQRPSSLKVYVAKLGRWGGILPKEHR